MSESSSHNRSARSSSTTFPGTSIHFDLAPTSRRAYSEDSTKLLDSPPVSVKSSGALLPASSSVQSSSSFTTSPSISSITPSIPILNQTESAQEHSSMKEDPIILRPEASQTTQLPSSSSPPRVERSTRLSSSMSTSTTHIPPPPLLFGDYLFPENPAVLDLLQVYQLDKSSKQKDFRQSLQLHAHLMGLALASRISRGLDLAYDHAHDAFKNKQRPDRRNEFVSSFNYAHEETERILHFALAQPHPRPSFLDMLSQPSSTAILSFLHLLRTNHTILAKAFQNLQSQELDMLLLPERASVHPVTQSGTRGARDRGYSMQFNSNGQATPNTFSQQSTHPNQHSYPPQSPTVPNFVNNQDIVHIILNNLFGPSTFQREHLLRTRTIKSIFTGLLPEKKGERLMTEILERYVIQSEWHQSSRAKGVFEKVLLDILHRGDSALVGFSDDELNAHVFPQQHHHHQSLGKMASIPAMKIEFSDSGGTSGRAVFGSKNIDQHGNSEPRALPTGRQAIVEEFFIEACLDILDVLEEFSPPCLFELSRMITQDLDESAKPYASLIIVVKFFFYRFMNKCIAYPETYGMFQDTFISEKQRQRILFTTHQRLYRYVTSILNPVPGWESRAPILDPRIREKVESFIETFSHSQDDQHTSTKSSLLPVAESSTPLPPKLHIPSASEPGTKSPTVTPFLLLCPSDFTTLFYFVCPNLRTQDRAQHGSLISSSASMTRSSSFNGKGSAGTRQRTSSETPPTYPAAMKAASQAAINSSTSSGPGGAPKATQNVTSTRIHKRASPSFSFFAGASSSMPFKARPPPPMTVEKAPSATAATEASASGVPFMALSGIKSGLTISPQTRPVEVTSSIGSIGPTLSTSPQTGDCRAHSASAPPAIEDPPVIKHWSDEKLLPALRTAITDIKNFQPGPIKEAPHVLNNSTLSPLREAWALAYVQYGEGSPSGYINMEEDVPNQALVEVGLALAPPCMAMVMENPGHGGSRIVTVTKPMLVDQAMDSAGGRCEFARSVDLEVDESDSESLMSPEDNSLNQSQTLSPEDKELSILRVNSSQMLSSMNDSGTTNIPNSGMHDDYHRTMEAPNSRGSSYSNSGRRTENQTAFLHRKKAADRAWKARIRETVHSEQDLPEEIRTVARSIFKVLREFDLISTGLCEQDTFNDGHYVVRMLLQQGIEQARQFGNHASAIGFHHALRVLETSALFRQLDSSKLIYLLAMPIKHRLEHRTGRARVRTIWESYSYQWHGRVVASIDRKRENLSSLRIKMYYQTCVRTSRAFEKSLGVVGVLSRLNKAVLRKYSAMDEWDSCRYSGGFDKSTTSLTDSDSKSGASGKLGKGGSRACDGNTCQESCLDHPCQVVYGETSVMATDAASRRHSGNTGPQSHVNRMGKGRRSSFSAYVDNMTSRSFGSQSLLESGLSNLKEREQATFSSGYNPNPGGTFWSHSNGSQSGLGDTDIPSDFVMDAREVEAVQRWIEDAGIHNFLPGEDNFLRFCMEIESVVRGIGLGGTGIQGAGIPQTLNGIIAPSLSSSGSDFFVKEVTKFNGQFVPGMGPSEPAVAQTKSASASGVAEFLVNSFKNTHAGTSAPSTSGSHFFSHATHGNNGTSNFGNQGQGSSYGLQSSQTSIHSMSSNASSFKSRLQQRQAQQKLQLNHMDALPNLLDNPHSIYASQPGPTYVLYNPPYATASYGASSSYSGSPPSGMSSTVTPHHTSLQPKDMTEFLRRIQLKLTSFVLSEWLDMFGEVEADRWLLEFLEELSGNATSGKDVGKSCDEDMLSKEDVNQDEDFLPVNEMDVGDKAILLPDLNSHSLCASSHESAPHMSANSSLGSIGTGDRTDSMTSWSSRSTHASDLGTLPKDGSSAIESYPVGSIPSAKSFVSSNKSLCSFPSMTSLASVLERETQPPVSSTGTIKASERGGLNIQVDVNRRARTPKTDPSATAPYNLHDAYRSTIEQFNQSKSPYQKLGYLFALELLIVASLSYPDSCANPAHPGPSSSSRTEVSEAMGLATGEQPMSPRAITPGTDAIVDEIENLFRIPGRVRPKHLLRDMQLIATFIPGSILDLRDDGKAFWDMALAVTSLKTDVIAYVVQKGTQYVEMDDDSTDSRQDTAKSGSRAIMQDDEERMRMSEAVRLFTIGAKESHPVAQRELAILYMSLPMLPASSSPMIGYSREDSSPLLLSNSRVPSPVSFTTGKYGRSVVRSTPPPSPKGTFSGTMLGTGLKSGTSSGSTSGMAANIPTSIPIKQKYSRHQHSSSGSGSSFGSGVLSGLGIITGLGSFTGSSSTGSTTTHEQQPYATSTHNSNGSTVSLHQCGEFAEGHDIEQYLDNMHTKTSASIASYQSGGGGGGGGSSSLHPYHQQRRQQHQQHQQQHQQQHHQQHHQHQHQAPRPDKFNPENVAAAMHWFSLAAAQGDKFSINYLKHKETAGGMMG